MLQTIHENVKEWQCRFCSKRFSNKSNMLLHEGNSHTGKLPYQCPVCQKGFARKPAVAEHVLNVHENPSEEGDVRENNVEATSKDTVAVAEDSTEMSVAGEDDRAAVPSASFPSAEMEVGEKPPGGSFFVVEEVENAEGEEESEDLMA